MKENSSPATPNDKIMIDLESKWKGIRKYIYIFLKWIIFNFVKKIKITILIFFKCWKKRQR